MTFKIKKKQVAEKYPTLTEANYLAIARKEGLSGTESYKYSQFMKRRFPNEKHTPYAQEWAVRFRNKNPESYMDSESLAIYNKILEKI